MRKLPRHTVSEEIVLRPIFLTGHWRRSPSVPFRRGRSRRDRNRAGTLWTNPQRIALATVQCRRRRCQPRRCPSSGSEWAVPSIPADQRLPVVSGLLSLITPAFAAVPPISKAIASLRPSCAQMACAPITPAAGPDIPACGPNRGAHARWQKARPSHELSQEYREFERASTVVANAYVGPRVAEYLAQLEQHLEKQGFGRPFSWCSPPFQFGIVSPVARYAWQPIIIITHRNVFNA